MGTLATSGVADESVEYTPVTSLGGRQVHAVALSSRPAETACGKFAREGWRVSLQGLSCMKCKIVVGEKRPPRKKKRKK